MLCSYFLQHFFSGSSCSRFWLPLALPESAPSWPLRVTSGCHTGGAPLRRSDQLLLVSALSCKLTPTGPIFSLAPGGNGGRASSWGHYLWLTSESPSCIKSPLFEISNTSFCFLNWRLANRVIMTITLA